MPERLELELRELGRELALPAVPDVSGRVAERLRAEPPPRRPRFAPPRRTLAIAIAILVVALAAALAVPPVRGALADLFHIGGVTVERVDELPPVTPGRGLGLGRRVTLDEARRAVDFGVLVPDADDWGEPDGAFVSRRIPGGVVSLLYGTERRPRLLATAFRGTTRGDLVKKALTRDTSIRFVRVRGTDGYFLSGAPHAVVFRDANGRVRDDEYRLAKNVLLWTEGDVTYRLEGAFGVERALAIAGAMR
jgi:hypothetical protein